MASLGAWREGFQLVGAALAIVGTVWGGTVYALRWMRRPRLALKAPKIAVVDDEYVVECMLVRRGRPHESNFDLALSFSGPGRQAMRQHLVIESTDDGMSVVSRHSLSKESRRTKQPDGRCRLDIAGSDQAQLHIPLAPLVDVTPPVNDWDSPEFHPWTGYARLEAKNESGSWHKVWLIQVHADVQEPDYEPKSQEMVMTRPEHESRLIRWFNVKQRRSFLRWSTR